MGFLEIPSCILGAPIANRFSRRSVVGGSLLIAGSFALIDLGISKGIVANFFFKVPMFFFYILKLFFLCNITSLF